MREKPPTRERRKERPITEITFSLFQSYLYSFSGRTEGERTYVLVSGGAGEQKRWFSWFDVDQVLASELLRPTPQVRAILKTLWGEPLYGLWEAKSVQVLPLLAALPPPPGEDVVYNEYPQKRLVPPNNSILATVSAKGLALYYAGVQVGYIPNTRRRSKQFIAARWENGFYCSQAVDFLRQHGLAEEIAGGRLRFVALILPTPLPK